MNDTHQPSQPTDHLGRRLINGCVVLWSEGGYDIIEHDNGDFMLYASWRVGEYKTFENAKKRAMAEIAKRLEEAPSQYHEHVTVPAAIRNDRDLTSEEWWNDACPHFTAEICEMPTAGGGSEMMKVNLWVESIDSDARESGAPKRFYVDVTDVSQYVAEPVRTAVLTALGFEADHLDVACVLETDDVNEALVCIRTTARKAAAAAGNPR